MLEKIKKRDTSENRFLALSIISIPSEVYVHGNAQLWNCIMIPLGVGLSCYSILPVFHRTERLV